MAEDFTIHCKEPTFHEAPEAERIARTERVIAIIRHELPNILPEEAGSGKRRYWAGWSPRRDAADG